VTDIKKGVAELLRADGFPGITEAVGAPAAHSRNSLQPVAVADVPP
jgi:hypothetical protein